MLANIVPIPVLVLLALAAVAILFVVLMHWGFKAPRLGKQTTPLDKGWPHKDVRIRTEGGKSLHGWWIAAERKTEQAASSPVIVITHGWGANAEMMLPLAEPFLAQGWNVLLFDVRNHGDSDGDGPSSLPKFAADTASAVNWLRQRPKLHSGEIILVGHSVGAAAVLLTAARLSERGHDERGEAEQGGAERKEPPTAVISISSFAHPEWLMRRYLGRLPLPGWLVNLVLAYVQRVIGFRFEDIAPVNTLRRVSCPVLLVHGSSDRVIPVSDFRALKRLNPARNISELLIDGAGHDSLDHLHIHADKLTAFVSKTLRQQASSKHCRKI